MMVPVDPGGHPHPISAHPFGLRHIESLTPDQIYARREGAHSAPPPQAMSSGAHQFHPPPHSGWMEAQPRGTQGPSMSSVASGTSQGIPHGGGPRRSPRSTAGPLFRFELQAPPPIHTLHSRAHPSGPSTGSGHHIVQQRPSPRGCGIGVHPGALQQRSNVMRAPPSAPVPGHRRRPEHLQLMGPLGEPMFVGSPAANVGEASTGPETVSRVLIPNCKIGAVIGKGGAIIKHIREVSGAKVTISDSCTGLHDDADDRMVTAAGTFNSVQLAFTHILSHAGAVGPDADPVMGLAGGDPDCVANAFRLLIPNVKAGGLIGRGGCTIKAIREHSGARIEISSHAFHFHPVHGPLLGPSAGSTPPTHGASGVACSAGGGAGGGEAPRVSGPRLGGGGHGGNGFGSRNSAGAAGDGGPMGSSGADRSGIVLPPPILMDRVMTAIGSFDACLRAHHLVASKLMDVRPSPVPMPIALPQSGAAPSSGTSAAFLNARNAGGGGGGGGGVQTPSGPPPRALSFESARGAAPVRGMPPPAPGITVTASTSPVSSASEQSSSHRHPWEYGEKSWKVSSIPSSPLSEKLGVTGGSNSSSPVLVSSSAVKASPGSSTSSIEGNGSAAENPAKAKTNAPANASIKSPPSLPQLSRTALPSTARIAFTSSKVEAHDTQEKKEDGIDTGGAFDVLETCGNGRNAGSCRREELPACLADIVDSFFGGRSNDAPAPRSPSTITGIDVEVGRAAFALLGVRDLDDIKHLSGAGITAPESPENYCHLSGEVLSAAAAVLSAPNGSPVSSAAAVAVAAARGEAPADGLGLAAAVKNSAAMGNALSHQCVGMGSNAVVRTSRSLLEAFGKDANDDEGHAGYPFRGQSLRGPAGQVLFKDAMGSAIRIGGMQGRMDNSEERNGAVSRGGVGGAGGSALAPNPLKTVRITGTAEEVQLAEYLIRVRTARRDMVAA